MKNGIDSHKTQKSRGFQQPVSASGAGRANRRALWLGFGAVLFPLLILLGLQYRWLNELQQKSMLARLAVLRNYLDYITEKVEYTYSKQAAVTLYVPASILTGPRENAIQFFRNKPAQGVKILFMLNFSGEHTEDPLFFDPTTGNRAQPLAIDTLYWTILAKAGQAIEANEFQVDERNPANPLITSPILDESSRLVGLAGMVVDVNYFSETLLPMVVHKTLHTWSSGDEWAVSVKDSLGRPVLAGDPGEEIENEVEKRFSFIFKEWTIGIRGRQSTAEQWARTNFLFNMSLSTILALLLIGGILLALRFAARELRLSEMKNDFVSNVSHELRTPLSSIRAFGELLRRGRATDPRKVCEYGEYIETESRRLSRLIDNILDFSKIETGQKVYHQDRQDVADVVDKVMKLFRVRLRDSNIQLVPQVAGDGNFWADIDADAIAHALSNLLDNAVKYSRDEHGKDSARFNISKSITAPAGAAQPGAAAIEVALARVGDEITISVKDCGIGISREEQARIFERFHRVSTGLVHDVKGSGLGLSIVQHIMFAHGGRVSVDSELGKGSTFTLHLPAQAAPRRAGDESDR